MIQSNVVIKECLKNDFSRHRNVRIVKGANRVWLCTKGCYTSNRMELLRLLTWRDGDGGGERALQELERAIAIGRKTIIAKLMYSLFLWSPICASHCVNPVVKETAKEPRYTIHGGLPLRAQGSAGKRGKQIWKGKQSKRTLALIVLNKSLSQVAVLMPSLPLIPRMKIICSEHTKHYR